MAALHTECDPATRDRRNVSGEITNSFCPIDVFLSSVFGVIFQRQMARASWRQAAGQNFRCLQNNNRTQLNMFWRESLGIFTHFFIWRADTSVTLIVSHCVGASLKNDYKKPPFTWINIAHFFKAGVQQWNLQQNICKTVLVCWGLCVYQELCHPKQPLLTAASYHTGWLLTL